MRYSDFFTRDCCCAYFSIQFAGARNVAHAHFGVRLPARSVADVLILTAAAFLWSVLAINLCMTPPLHLSNTRIGEQRTGAGGGSSVT